jgi:hypothetical protein
VSDKLTRRLRNVPSYEYGATGVVYGVASGTPDESLHEEAADRIEELEQALRDVRVTMNHARIFITSRQKMAAVGVELYDQDIARIYALLTLSAAPEKGA